LNCTFRKARIPTFIIAQGSIVFVKLPITSERQGKLSERVNQITLCKTQTIYLNELSYI